MQYVDKLDYDYFVEKAAEEIRLGQVNEGLWAQAFIYYLNNLAEKNNGEVAEEETEKLYKLYWNENPPQKIVIASASTRKAIQIAAALDGFTPKKHFSFIDLPYDPTEADNPLQLGQMMEEHIRNGDGALTKEIELGEYFGVPVFMCPSNGETSSNEDPIDQSLKKIDDIKEQYADEDVIIIASDTVGQVDGVDGKLGKPVNVSKDVIPLSPDDPEFAAIYRELFWKSSSEIAHLNGLVALRLHQAVEVDLLTEFKQQIPSDEELDGIEVQLEVGAGGLTQQLIEWDQPILDQLPDGPLKQGLAHFPEELHAILLFNHVIGAPVWVLPAFLRGLVVQEKHVAPVHH